MALKNLTDSLLLSASQCWFANLPLTQNELANALAAVNIIKNSEVIQCLSQIDRKKFTNDPEPYANKPCSIGNGEVITSPSTQGLILEILYSPLKNSSKILDLGCGLGYISQCMALLNPNSQIIAVDIHKELIIQAKNLNTFENIEFRHCEAHEIVEDQFDTINVGFNANQNLFEQLCWKVGNGTVLCPVDGRWIFFDGKENLDFGEVGFSQMRVLENLEEEFGEIEKQIKELYLETEKKLSRRPNITELPNEIHGLLNKRRRIQNRIKSRELRGKEKKDEFIE